MMCKGDIMKALTIKQPWASLIINGYKEYEFRSWKTNYRGKILIHAGLAMDREACERVSCYNLDYIKGAIIGEAVITDCILVSDSFKKELMDINPLVYNRTDVYAWKLENIVMYDKPIFVKGKLGLWNYDINE